MKTVEKILTLLVLTASIIYVIYENKWNLYIFLVIQILLLSKIIFFDKWSKVNMKTKKPLIWWYHKLMCELWYRIEGSGMRYHKHLMIMCNKYKLNLYGEKY